MFFPFVYSKTLPNIKVGLNGQFEFTILCRHSETIDSVDLLALLKKEV